MKSQYKNMSLFLLIAFFLPLLSILVQGMISNVFMSFLLYGIQAASPTIAAIIVLCLNGESKEFFIKKFQKKHILAAVVLPVVIACMTMFFAKLSFCVLFKVEFVSGRISSLQFIVILWAFFAEEIGWRGYLEPLLKMNVIHRGIVPFIIGIIWCLWHYHYFLQNGVQVPIPLFLISCIIESYIYSFLMYNSNDNIISAMTYHFSWNLWIHIFAVNPVDNNGSIFPYTALVVIEAFVLLAFFMKKRKMN